MDTPLRGYGVHRRVNDEGYVLLWSKTIEGSDKRGYIYEHRHVMAQMIGRPLKANERVHHRNGKRDDNRPENLELWVSSHPAGQRVDELVAWAQDIIAEYGELEIAGTSEVVGRISKDGP